jgi:hypothetical protein
MCNSKDLQITPPFVHPSPAGIVGVVGTEMRPAAPDQASATCIQSLCESHTTANWVGATRRSCRVSPIPRFGAARTSAFPQPPG